MQRSRKSGYALLLVLVTLTICALALTGLATRSMQANSDSLERLRALQSRWGRLSCSRTLLRDAPAVFDAIEKKMLASDQLSKPIFPIALTETVELGGHRFTMVLADENAKLNLNMLQRLGRPGTLATSLRKVLGPNSNRALRDIDRNPGSRTLSSWGEVFDLKVLRTLQGSDRVLAELTREVTLWGSGKLNLRRASPSSLELACKGIVTDGLARRIVERHDESPTLNTGLLLQQTVLNETDRGQLEQLLGDGSTTFSVWIESEDGRQRSQHYSVSYVDGDGKRSTESFSLN